MKENLEPDPFPFLLIASYYCEVSRHRFGSFLELECERCLPLPLRSRSTIVIAELCTQGSSHHCILADTPPPDSVVSL